MELANNGFLAEVTVADALTTDVILGRDFLRRNDCTIQMTGAKDILSFGKQGITVLLSRVPFQSCINSVKISTAETLQIPPNSELEVMCKVPLEAVGQTWLTEGLPGQGRTAALLARAVVKPTSGEIPVRLLNSRSEPVVIQRGAVIGKMDVLEEDSISVTSSEAPTAETDTEQPTQEQKESLWRMAEAAGDQLSDEHKESLYALLLEYADLFARHPDDFGRTSKVKHTIHTGGAQPIRQPVRRIPQAHRGEAKVLIRGMLEKKVIQPSNGPWASPVVLVRKKDGSLRFCVDYRKINAVTRKDAYPLPRVDDTLDTLAGAKWFSALDLLSGYWQVEMAGEDQEKTAFCTPEGLFEFSVMPFGLCNAPATFQRLMDMVLTGLQWDSCLVYLDDILIVGKTFSKHLHNLRDVFGRLRGAGLKLQPRKCGFCLPEVGFLGHIVSATGVSTDPSKTEKVAEWPVPSTKREVQQFLGLANYYRKFVQDFASIAKPLHRLTEKNVRFSWTLDCQKAFELLRQKLVSSPILAFPDYSREFILDTDASDIGLGAVLSQIQDDGTERVVAYASRVLTKPERRYCVTRRELLAVVTFIQHFRPYLLGRSFTLRTDHGSLTWIAKFREPEGQLARWLERLQEYTFTIVHRPGRKHQNADALSRMPCSQCGRDSHGENQPTDESVCAIDGGEVRTDQRLPGPLQMRSKTELRRLQTEDEEIGYVLRAKESGSKPTKDELKGKSLAVRRLIEHWDRLDTDDGILHRHYQEQKPDRRTWTQLVVPRVLREELLQDLHAGVMGGHLGAEKTLGRLRERFFWPGNTRDVTEWCRTCANCVTKKMPVPKQRAPLQTIKAGYPLQIVAVDITGPFPESDNGNSYILVASDYFTRWTEAYAIPNQEATTVARKLVTELFCRFSPPEQLHSDQGRQFESELVHEVCKVLGISKSRTTPYHPQSDGLVERFNKTLQHMLATTVRDHPFDWEELLPMVCMAYNTSTHSTTGYTPFYLMFGREARLPVDIAYGTREPDLATPSSYASNLQKSLREAYHRVRTSFDTGHQHRKEIYDKKVHGRQYESDELVWLHSPAIPRGQSKKLHHAWTGPYRVLQRLSECDYRIQVALGQKKPPIVVHFNRLKLCLPGTRFPSHKTPTERKNAPGPKPPQQQEPFGTHMDIIYTNGEMGQDGGEPNARYPQRHRQPPHRFGDLITHQNTGRILRRRELCDGAGTFWNFMYNDIVVCMCWTNCKQVVCNPLFLC